MGEAAVSHTFSGIGRLDARTNQKAEANIRAKKWRRKMISKTFELVHLFRARAARI